ncbi:hypothetical protein BC831DRAFT_246086 [Entophlyctis helioformis]|nr:hypothetical protein BC831DRAFT_246086 [Entophlyctis helioformis]
MGNLTSTAVPRAAVAGIDSYVSELPELAYEKSMGSSRFLKTIRCRHPEGLVVVKIYVKPQPGLSLKRQLKELQHERDLLSGLPNILAYHHISETERAGYLFRQFIASNVYDRISNRPFMTTFEKKWISFQILMGVVEAHSRQVYHGDIKTENIFVTSWNWVYLSDFSSFKPAHLPEDNPADFAYFFDTSARRSCYLAPERFLDPSAAGASDSGGKLTWEMDIFALGCTMAEIFLEGVPVFTLSQLLRYRKGKYDPTAMIDKIEDASMRSMIKHMLQLDPSGRLTAQEYLSEWRGKAFPEYFYVFLHPYLASLSDPYASASSTQYHVFLANNTNAIVADADAKIDRIYYDFDRIADALEIPNPRLDRTSLPGSTSVLNEPIDSSTRSRGGSTGSLDGPPDPSVKQSVLPKTLLPVHVHIPKFVSSTIDMAKSARAADGCLVLIAVICATIRNTLYPTSRLRGLDLLLTMGMQVSDEHKLDRIVPYMVTLLSDENPIVRINALAALTQLLGAVKSMTPSDASIFPDYILPSLKRFLTDPNTLARAAYAQCLPAIAEIAFQFLELSQLLKTEGNPDLDMDTNLYQMSYDANLRDLQDAVQEDVVALLIDPHSLVKRSLLTDMPRLCIFFGRQKANDVLLSHMITYLNDPDWMLRSAFCEAIVGVGTFVGMRSLEEYILPLMVQALTDAEEFVVEKVLNSLTSLAELGLIAKSKLRELCTSVLPLVCHPNRWIRYGVVAFLAASARLMPLIDVRCVLYPMVKPFLRREAPSLTEIGLLENIKSPISRQLYEHTILYASKNSGNGGNLLIQGSVGSYTRQGVGSYQQGNGGSPRGTHESSGYGGNQGGLLSRLKELGMADEDKEKLFAMKYFIAKASAARLRRQDSSAAAGSGLALEADLSHIALRDHGVTLHTVFLTPPANQPASRQNDLRQSMSTGLNGSRNALDSKRGSRANLAIAAATASLSPLLGLGVASTAGTAGSGSVAGEIASNKSSPSSSIAYNGIDSMVSQDRISPASSLDMQEGLAVQRRAIPRPRSESHLPGGVKRHSKTSSIGNYDLTADPAMVLGSNDRHSRRSSWRGRVATTVESATAADGQEKYIRRVLEKKTKELFPPPLPELGPKVTLEGRTAAVDARLRRVRAGVNAASELKGWRPKGILVAHFAEHVNQVNAIRVAPDHGFFATCSDDGTVKIWDTNRLHTNVANRARLTYSGMGGRVKAITFCESKHSIVSSSDNGQIHINRVEYIKPAQGSIKYTGFAPVQSLALRNEHATLLDHCETDMQSLLIFGTTRGRFSALDLRSMKEAWSFQIPPHHGSLTAMTFNRKNMWALTGTHRGVLSLWDIRFQLCAKTWMHPSRARINKLAPYLCKSQTRAGMNAGGKLVAMSVANASSEISVWNVSTGQCAEVFGVASEAGGTSTWSSVDADHELQRVFVDGLQSMAPPSMHELTDDTASLSLYGTHKHQGVRSFSIQPDGPFMVAVGNDRKLRYWDLGRIDDSYVVSGNEDEGTLYKYSSSFYQDANVHLESPASQHLMPQPAPSSASGDHGRVASTQSWSPLRNLPGMQPTDEVSRRNSGSAAASSGSANSSSSSTSVLGAVTGQGSSQPGGSSAARASGSRSVSGGSGRSLWLSDRRTTAGSSSEALITSAVPRRHLDGMTDVAVTQFPHPMIITSGRDGVVKVWQ